jgi:LPS export ABC transporter protein LptC
MNGKGLDATVVMGRMRDPVWRTRGRLASMGAAAAVMVVALTTGCDKPVDTPVAAEAVQEITADMVTYGMTSYLTADGVRQGRVDADTAYLYNDSSEVSIIGMRVIFFDDDGRDRATVTADSGRLNQRTQRMLARGHVVLVVAADGRKIESAELNYDPDKDRIWSDSATVQTMRNGSVTRGTSFESDLEFKNVRIRNIRGGGDIVF